MLFKSLLAAASLAVFVNVSATPLPLPDLSARDLDYFEELYERDYLEELYERDIIFEELLARGKQLFASKDDYSKDAAVKFVQGIPHNKFVLDPPPKEGQKGSQTKQKTLHSVDAKGNVAKDGEHQNDGFRLDYQGPTSEGGHHNLQVQINTKHGDKSMKKTTVGGIKTDGHLGAKKMKKALDNSVRHPRKNTETKQERLPSAVKKPNKQAIKQKGSGKKSTPKSEAGTKKQTTTSKGKKSGKK